MKELVAALKTASLTIGTCESLTGGLFASELTSVAGVSSVFKGGFVTYWNACKVEVVHVHKETIQAFGVVSAQTAMEMAENARRLLTCDCAVSFTGNAGPDVLEGRPVGLVYSAVAFADAVYVYELQLSGERNRIRENVCLMMKEVLMMLIKKRQEDDFVLKHQELMKKLGISAFDVYI